MRIASTPRPENCAGWVTASHGARSRRNVLPLSFERSRVRPRKRRTPARSTADGRRRSAPARRRSPAARRRRSGARRRSGPAPPSCASPSARAETSISVTIVVLCSGSVGRRDRPADRLRARTRPWSRSPARGRRAAAAGGRSRRASSVPVTAPRRVDDAQRAVGDGEDPPAVGLDDVRLVDADLLHVRARELGHGRGRAPRRTPARASSTSGARGDRSRGVATASSAGGATARPTTPTPPCVRSAPVARVARRAACRRRTPSGAAAAPLGGVRRDQRDHERRPTRRFACVQRTQHLLRQARAIRAHARRATSRRASGVRSRATRSR